MAILIAGLIQWPRTRSRPLAAPPAVTIAIGRVAERPQGLDQFATCQLTG